MGGRLTELGHWLHLAVLPRCVTLPSLGGLSDFHLTIYLFFYQINFLEMIAKKTFFLWWYFCPSVHLFRGGEEDVVLVGDERQPRQVERVEQGARHRGS